MIQNRKKNHPTSVLVSLIIFSLGIVLCVASLAFNWLTANSNSGANIGAGLIFLASLGLMLLGLIICGFSFLKKSLK